MGYENLHFLQKGGHDCGGGIVAPLLDLCHVDYKYDELLETLGTTEQDGTHPIKMASFLVEKGFKVVIYQNSSIARLKHEVDSGNICVAMFQNWETWEYDPELECGHYAFVDNVSNGKLVTIDPGIKDGRGPNRGKWQYPIEEFERVWIDQDKGRIINKGFISISR